MQRNIKWPAIAAALLISAGAVTTAGVGAATSPDGAAAFVPISPRRLFDTRPDSTVGPRSTPLGADESYVVEARGAHGTCDLPADVTGVVMNVTAVGATAATFVTVYPADHERPVASHLNPKPADGAVPNAVTTDLDDDGRFAVFNRFGSVHVLADVVGYYTEHHHDDRYYPRAETYSRSETYSRAEVDQLVAQPGVSDRYAGRGPYQLTLGGNDFRPTNANYPYLEFDDGVGVMSGNSDAYVSATPPLPAGAIVHAVELHIDPNDGPIQATLKRFQPATGIGVEMDTINIANGGAVVTTREFDVEPFVVEPTWTYRIHGVKLDVLAGTILTGATVYYTLPAAQEA